jgi:hypothetical protein
MDAGLNQPFSIEKILLGGAKLSTTLIDEALNYQLPIYLIRTLTFSLGLPTVSYRCASISGVAVRN